MSVAAALSRAAATVTPWHALLREEGQTWLYISKTLLALWLAGWLGMRLAMPSPVTCMITVLIVMNRQTGLVLAKAFYRGTGTLLGCVAGVALVALFPQQPLLLLAAMALWAGAMAAGAMINRNLRAYTFVLAGYTVAMIVLPSVNDPASVFDTAVWRLAEVGLGLVVASCVFDIAWPNRLHAPLQGQLRSNARDLLALVAKVAGRGPDDLAGLAAAHRRLGGRAVALEDLRSTAQFDDPSLRASDALLRRINQRYLSVLTRLQLLQRAWRRVGPARAAVLADAMLPLAAILDDALPEQPVLRQRLQAWRAVVPGDLPGARSILALAAALDDYLAAVQAADLDASHRLPAGLRRAPPPFVRITDPLAVVLTFARAAGLMFVLGLLWIGSGWKSGGTALFGIVALLSMLSSAPQPAVIARQISLGHLLAPLLVLPFYSLLPVLPSFPLLVLGTAPLFLLILRIGAHPPTAPLGMALNMGTMVALGFGLAPEVDPAFYLNDALAIAIGAGLALLGFILVPNLTGSRGQRRRLLALYRRQVGFAALAPLRGLQARFDSRSQDLLRQIEGLLPAGSAAVRRLDDWMWQVHEVGHALIAMRLWVAGEKDLAGQARQALRRLQAALAAQYAHPCPARRADVQAALQHAREQLPQPAARALLDHLQDVLGDGHRVVRPATVNEERADA